MKNPLHSWVVGIAQSVVDADRARIRDENAKKVEPPNVDGELADGVVLCYAYDKKLYPVREWVKKAEAWQNKYCPKVSIGKLFFSLWGVATEDPSGLRKLVARYLVQARLVIAKEDFKKAKAKAKKEAR